MGKSCPTPGWKSNRVISVSHGVIMIKFNGNTFNFLMFLIFQYLVLIEILILYMYMYLDMIYLDTTKY